MNHNALPDCLQTRLLMLDIEELLKPCEEREGWKPEVLAKSSQLDLRNFMVTKP